MSGILSSLKYAEVEASASKGNPSGAVRANGTIVFNLAAALIVGFPLVNLFRLGNDEAGKLYLVPAKEGEANAIKATKNNDSFMFKQTETFAKLGAVAKTKYAVEAAEEEGVKYFVLTPQTKAEAAAEAAGEAKEGESGEQA